MQNLRHFDPDADSDFSGLWIPLITPFHHGDIDTAALKRLVSRYKDSGIAGLVVCGSTGEAAALSDEEQRDVLQLVMQEAAGLPIVFGVSGYHLGKTAARIRTLGALGIAGILLSAPHYVRPAQAGLIDWFTALADASTVPLIVYDIPYRTGAHITLETLRALASHPNIRAIKDCGGDAVKTAALMADGRLQVLCGEDANIFSTMAQGGDGVIAAAAHVHTARFVRIIELLKAGQVAAADALWQPLLSLIGAMFSEPNPGPLKALLAQHGLVQNELRSPMTRASDALSDKLRQLDAAVSASQAAGANRP
jgi:4-hydroxy-tetrahydrodipicolinate synthase